MIELAMRYDRHPDRCRFLVNDSDRLGQFEDASFGFVYSNIVLQHVDPEMVDGYLNEFVRVLGRGGILVFQLPDRLRATWLRRMRRGLQLGTHLRRAKSALKIAEKEYVMTMHERPESSVREALGRLPVRLVDVRLTNATSLNYNGQLEYLSTESAQGLLSKQYCAVRI